MLETANLSVAHGLHQSLEGVSLRVDRGEIVVILGANGAGKSTLLRAIGGTCEGTRSGEVRLDGAPIAGLEAHEIVERGVALVPEGRGIFPDLTVRENLMLGAFSRRARQDETANLEQVESLFPKLRERRHQVVRTMSGGEQQMVAIGRAMMSSPQILMLDEPSLGLSPLLCKELFHSLTEVRKTGLGILLVEQNAKQSLAIADRGYLLENAHIVGEGPAAQLLSDPAVQKAYLGGAAGETRPRAAQPATRTPARPAAKTPARSDAQEAARAAAQANTRAAAAQAAESALAFISTGGERKRLRTDDVVAGGIDKLVRHAAELSTDRVGDKADRRPPTVSRRPAKPYGGATGPLADMLADMERAAAAALEPRRPTPSPSARQVSPTGPSHDPVEPPEIEIWRREPEIKIYRRSGGKLRRVKGD